MQKLVFDPRKYGRELLIDTVDMDNFDPGGTEVLPSFYTIACLSQAHGHMQINAQQLALTDRMILFIPAGQLSRIPDAHFQEGIFLFFEGTFLDGFFQDPFFVYQFDFFHQVDWPYHLPVEEETFRSVYALFQELHQEIRDLQPDSDHFLRSILYHLLIRLNRLYGAAYETDGRLIRDPLLLQFKHLMSKRIPEWHQVQRFADVLNISRVSLNRKVQKYFGKTASQVIRERLMIEAQKALRYDHRDIASIAYDLHFSDPANFTRFFKAMTGQTPQVYRDGVSD